MPGIGGLLSIGALTAPSRLLGARAVAGVVMLAAPTAAARGLGADTGTARRITWLTQMLAIRDGAIAVGGLVALRRGSPTPWLLAGAVSDAVDALVLGAALKQHRLGGLGPTAVVPIAAASAAAGAVAALRAARS